MTSQSGTERRGDDEPVRYRASRVQSEEVMTSQSGTETVSQVQSAEVMTSQSGTERRGDDEPVRYRAQSQSGTERRGDDEPVRYRALAQPHIRRFIFFIFITELWLTLGGVSIAICQNTLFRKHQQDGEAVQRPWHKVTVAWSENTMPGQDSVVVVTPHPGKAPNPRTPEELTGLEHNSSSC
ncbi:hypothetical protein JZ751_004708 [Albula glossodonta]|uniref:Uncharacterized protein n=1 Tax=Albula glossodonta TaxID=121402 RepID=A0A8T2MPD3_9TELE|nr:hypothetical protein JZ751_004708 [Albula glossodonta]